MTQEILTPEARLALKEVLSLRPEFKWTSEDDIWDAYWKLTSEEIQATG